MKAFKQISYSREYKLFWSYSVFLSLLGLFILITPVLAQEPGNEHSEPKVKIEVDKIYDEDGNLISVDSSKTWCWSGKSFSFDQKDSIWDNIAENFDHFFHRNYKSPDYFNNPPMHRFWEWDESDSTVTSFFSCLTSAT